MNVACEACHGPASRHVDWAQSGKLQRADKGLVADFSQRHAVAWPIDPASGSARPSSVPTGPTEARTEVQVCARCHAHRSQEWPDYAAGQPLADSHRISAIAHKVCSKATARCAPKCSTTPLSCKARCSPRV